MAGPIYLSYRAKPTEAWYQLSQKEQGSLMTKVGEALEKVGGKSVVLCDSSWAAEEWQFFGINEYPDIEAVQKHSELLGELNWLRYVDSSTILGTEMQPPS